MMFAQTCKNIDDILWKDAGCSSELDYQYGVSCPRPSGSIPMCEAAHFLSASLDIDGGFTGSGLLRMNYGNKKNPDLPVDHEKFDIGKDQYWKDRGNAARFC